MSKPDFIGIGAMKAGTTWLYQCLSEHPEIFLIEKEFNFFSNKKKWLEGFDWYEKQLENSKKVTGEFSVVYLPNPHAHLRIHNRYPNTKLIVCLRNPADRTFSHYLHGTKSGFINKLISFSEAVKQFPHLTQTSCYSTFIKKYLKYFSPQQMLFLIYEDSLKDPLQYVQSVYRFLEVDDQFVPPSLEKNIFPSYKPRFNLLEKIIYRRALVRFAKKTWLGKKMGRVTSQLLFNFNKEQVSLSDADRDKMEKYFYSEIKELESLIGRPLTQWLRYE
ncbi:TPA: hypothetical protein DGT35_00990 [Patescibacteria group bacterium]|nr:hypothetical protein [Patescibacteria group bacterium]